jgi:hypothetical protein
MSSLINDPQHWRERTKEARDLAEQMTDPEARRTMLSICEGYETGQNEPKLGGDSKNEQHPSIALLIDGLSDLREILSITSI